MPTEHASDTNDDTVAIARIQDLESITTTVGHLEGGRYESKVQNRKEGSQDKENIMLPYVGRSLLFSHQKLEHNHNRKCSPSAWKTATHILDNGAVRKACKRPPIDRRCFPM